MASKSDKELIFMPNGGTPAPAEGEEFLPALDEMTPREIVAELDKYIAVRDCAAQPRTASKAARGNRRGYPSEEYFDDWSDGRGQNENREASGASRGMPVCEGGSFE